VKWTIVDINIRLYAPFTVDYVKSAMACCYRNQPLYDVKKNSLCLVLVDYVNAAMTLSKKIYNSHLLLLSVLSMIIFQWTEIS
jgi:hypothetical protein